MKKTVDYIGSKRVIVRTLGGGNDKLALSLVLGANSKGELYPPVVLLKGKSYTPKNLKSRLKKTATDE